MNKHSQFIASIAVLALGLFAGCGRDVSGTYTGTESTQTSGQYLMSNGLGIGAGNPNDPNYMNTLNDQLANQQSSAVTITLVHQDGDKVTGTWYSKTGSGNFTSNLNGEQLLNFNLVLNSSLPTNYNNGGVYYGGSYVNGTCSNTYTGPLLLKNDQISGVLNAQATQNCPGTTRNVTATKKN